MHIKYVFNGKFVYFIFIILKDFVWAILIANLDFLIQIQGLKQVTFPTKNHLFLFYLVKCIRMFRCKL